MTPFWVVLLSTAAGTTALLLVAFGIALRVGRWNVVDTFWGLGFAVVAVIAFALAAGHGSTARQLTLLLATLIWGTRLAVYVGWRSRGAGEDPRYTEMLSRTGGNRPAYALRKVFLLQAALIWIISAPIQAGMFQRGPTWTIAAGLAIWLLGLSFEVIGDWQLARFKARPHSHGHVMDRGLWRYTRHPNYFGDACVWWGLFVISCGTWLGLVTAFAPVVMTVLLAAGSGKPITEQRLRGRPGYAEYVARTSGFVPWPPRLQRHRGASG
jgi:steroid 5-alpha reductase family enzyme